MNMPFHGIILSDYSRPMHAGIKMLGQYKIANILRSLGYNILVIESYSQMPKKDLFDILEKSISSETLFLGHSSTMYFGRVDKNSIYGPPQFFPGGNSGEELFIDINKLSKRINPNLQVLLGGAGSRVFMGFVNQFKNNFSVDFVMHGYSENMIVDFVGNLKNNQQHKFSDRVQGIRVIEYDYLGQSHDFRNHSLNSFSTADFVQPHEYLSLEIARGCIFKCKFCSYPLLGKAISDLSYIRTEENILSEILYNYENFKSQSYLIVDDTFNERNDKIEMMLRIRDRSKLDLNFVGYNRIELINSKNQYDLLKDLNFNGMFFGIESFNYPSAKAIGKGIKSEKIIETLYKLKEKFNNKIAISAGFIIGLPYETRDTIANWTDLLFTDNFPIDNISFSGLGIKKNEPWGKSEFGLNPEKYGYSLGVLNYWKNEHWDDYECFMIANELNKKVYQSGRNKIGAFQLPVYGRIGLTFNDVIGKRLIDGIEIETRLYEDYQKKYIAHLKQSVGLQQPKK